MTVKKSLQQRETELQALLATPAGKNELQEMAARYAAAGARLRPGPHGQKTRPKANIMGDVALSVACAHPLV